MENAVYEKISPIGELDELKIYTWYSKGSGIFVNFRPVHRDNGCESCVLLGSGPENGLKFLVKKTSRKSQKQEKLIFESIASHSNEFARMYDKREFEGIGNLCYELANN